MVKIIPSYCFPQLFLLVLVFGTIMISTVEGRCSENVEGCSSPQQSNKTCKETFGFYLSGCRDEDCDVACYNRHPGIQQGHGSCISVPPYLSCSCAYYC
ncbi:hypothetical protein Peur_008453 [Populus x canadensis]